MERKLNENGILTGIADYFCLTCKKYLKSNETSGHINEPEHQETFQFTYYVEKYKEDRIRKLDMGYYCEICNIIVPYLARVGIHINEITHLNNKNKCQLKETDAGIVVFDDILIEDNAWNGMADGSCFLCNVDYSNETDHKYEQTHILKLIQSKFDLLKDKFVYRLLDDDYINCLICNTILINKCKETHINETAHKEKYAKCQLIREGKVKTSYCNNSNVDENLIENVISDESKNYLVKIEVPENNTYETQIVVFNTNQEFEIKFDDNLITPNDDLITPVDDLITPDDDIKSAMKFAEQNGLNYKRTGTYCRLCDVKINSTLKEMREHICEASHMAKKAEYNRISKINKVPQEKFVKTFTSFIKGFVNNVVINNKICLDILSFFVISENNGVPICLSCQVTLAVREVVEHVPSVQHTKAMETMNVLTDFESEYIREVVPVVFHCGYCNFVERSLDSLKNHLKTIDHLTKKRMFEICLQECLLIPQGDRRNWRHFVNYIKMVNSSFSK